MQALRLLAAVALAALFLAPAASAEVWQWTDAEGMVRYTPNPNRVPQSQRGSLIKLEPGMQAPAPSPSRPRYAPPEELPLGADPFAAPEPARTLEVPETEPAAEPEAEVPAPPEAQASTTPAPSAAPVEAPGPRAAAVEASTPSIAAVEASTPHALPGEAPDPSVPPVEAPPPRATPVEASTPSIAAVEAPAPQAAPGDEPEPPPAPRLLSDAERARRVQLEEQIAADQEALKDLISQEAAEGDEPLRESPELREIARRLPALQAELRTLEGVPERRGERAAPKP